MVCRPSIDTCRGLYPQRCSLRGYDCGGSPSFDGPASARASRRPRPTTTTAAASRRRQAGQTVLKRDGFSKQQAARTGGNSATVAPSPRHVITATRTTSGSAPGPRAHRQLARRLHEEVGAPPLLHHGADRRSKGQRQATAKAKARPGTVPGLPIQKAKSGDSIPAVYIVELQSRYDTRLTRTHGKSKNGRISGRDGGNVQHRRHPWGS